MAMSTWRLSRRGWLIGCAVLLSGCASDWTREMQLQLDQLSASLSKSGVIVSRTHDNRIKLHIPSDLSFAIGSANIKPDFAQYLRIISSSLSDYPKTTVKVIGHTDSTGSAGVNLPLSFDRARRTRDFMIDRGVAQSRFETDGRASTEPVADNGSADGRAMNRRVEMYVAVFGHPQSAPILGRPDRGQRGRAEPPRSEGGQRIVLPEY